MRPEAPEGMRARKTEKATLISERGLYLCRQRPTLPRSCGAGAPAREKGWRLGIRRRLSGFEIVTF
jgi:hypothetical protein